MFSTDTLAHEMNYYVFPHLMVITFIFEMLPLHVRFNNPLKIIFL